MQISSGIKPSIHEIKVLAFKDELAYLDQVERVRQLVRLMASMVGFLDGSAFYSETSNRWVLHLLWSEADEPYIVSATAADANAIIARLTQSARLVRVVP